MRGGGWRGAKGRRGTRGGAGGVNAALLGRQHMRVHGLGSAGAESAAWHCSPAPRAVVSHRYSATIASTSLTRG